VPPFFILEKCSYFIWGNHPRQELLQRAARMFDMRYFIRNMSFNLQVLTDFGHEIGKSVGIAKIAPDPHRHSAAKGLHSVLGGSPL
jgi:hypothetical protein